MLSRNPRNEFAIAIEMKSRAQRPRFQSRWWRNIETVKSCWVQDACHDFNGHFFLFPDPNTRMNPVEFQECQTDYAHRWSTLSVISLGWRWVAHWFCFCLSLECRNYQFDTFSFKRNPFLIQLPSQESRHFSENRNWKSQIHENSCLSSSMSRLSGPNAVFLSAFLCHQINRSR